MFRRRDNKSRQGAGGVAGAVVSVLLGLIFLLSPWEGLTHLSYDVPFLLRNDIRDSEVVIVQLDESSLGNYTNLLDRVLPYPSTLPLPPHGKWHRALHAELLQAMNMWGARLVVFDIVFDQPWPDEPGSPGMNGEAVDLRLARALEASGNVVLSGLENRTSSSDGSVKIEARFPHSILSSNAVMGVADLPLDSDNAYRRHAMDPPFTPYTNLAWQSAVEWGATTAFRHQRRYLNYYGPPGTVPTFSLYQVLGGHITATNLFEGKAVFVGTGNLLKNKDDVDMHPTPHTTWGHGKMAGVEIQATAFLNLIRNDWLTRMPSWMELAVILVAGLASGRGFARMRPWTATGVAAGAGLFISAGAVLLALAGGLWFAWLIVVGIQIPASLFFGVITTTRRLYREKDQLMERLHSDTQLSAAPTVSTPVRSYTPEIPSHTLLKPIGRGAYGEVWLARDNIPRLTAVKIVHRMKFADDSPFEREFNGLKKFAPVSLRHPGLVDVLQVGRNEAEDFFYYIMVAGDDVARGQDIDPETYQPLTLSRRLKQDQRLPVTECIELGIVLSQALGFLHENNLIHRDIKPANIIYVEGAPMIADIGLVTDLASNGEDVTLIGTRYFIPPEGPGTAAADIFSLGKLLYVVAFGLGPGRFPELPEDLDRWPESTMLNKLWRIIQKACDPDERTRYRSTEALRADLVELQQGLPS